MSGLVGNTFPRPGSLGVDLPGWREFDEVMLRLAPGFARVEPRSRVVAFVQGLLTGPARLN